MTLSIYVRVSRTLASLMAVTLFSLFSTMSHAEDYYGVVPGTPTVKVKLGGEGATDLKVVFGKEYSHTNPGAVSDPRINNIDDHDAGGLADAAQVVSWDGQPGPIGGNSGSVNGFDFEPGLLAFDQSIDIPQIDALANHADLLFKQIIRNEATLLFSMTADTGASGGLKSRVHFEDPDPVDLVADPLDVWVPVQSPVGPGPGVNHHRVFDLDALEVWGPEPPPHDNQDTPVRGGYVGGGPGVGTPTADSDRFSLDNDSVTGVSVWAYDISTGFVGPWIPQKVIADAVEELFLKTSETGLRFSQETRAQIDVDGTMARDLDNSSPTAPIHMPGDELLFTIDPIDDPVVLGPTGGPGAGIPAIDGGEIMHLAFNAGGFSIEFLDHGGHLWDTAFDVAGTFGYEFEDVDALEAVGVIEGTDIGTPEPGTIVICGLAVLIAGGYQYRRRRA